MTKISVVAGGAGFIAQSLIDELLLERRVVFVIDNLCRGKRSFLNRYRTDNRVKFYEGDLSSRKSCQTAFKTAKKFGNIDEIWHLAANSDIAAGVYDADIDVRNTFLTTVELLNSAKLFNVKRFYFASSSAVYGDHGGSKLSELTGPLAPISNYGAMKLASEALICVASQSDLSQACIYRFPNVVGLPATHGVIFDFINKLMADPKVLKVLGDGFQKKIYLHVTELVDAMMTVRKLLPDRSIEVINIGPNDSGVSVKSIADLVVRRLGVKAKIIYGTGSRGWLGDVPKFQYSTKKMELLYGWKPKLRSRQAIELAVNEIAAAYGL
jgi:UDP-glucose 4-epimerase